MVDEKPEELVAAKKERASAAMWLTRAANSAEELKKQDLKSVSLTKYEKVCNSFYDKLTKWEEVQHRVELLTDEAALEVEIGGAADYKEGVDNKICELEEAWLEAHPPAAVSEVAPTSSSTSAASCQPSVTLPKLDLPKFHGDVIQFTSYWQQFEQIVDGKEGLAAVTKFSYLVSTLKGDAKDVIDGLPITNENYETAKQLVKNRFGRKDLIIAHHIHALLTLPVASRTTDLIRFYDTLMGHVRALASLGITSDQFGVILTPIIVSRLSQDICDEWSRVSEGHEADLDHLMDFLDKEIRRRGRCITLGGMDKSSERKPAHEGWRGQRNRPPGTATALHSGSDNNSRKCVFCKKNHVSGDLLTVSTNLTS